MENNDESMLADEPIDIDTAMDLIEDAISLHKQKLAALLGQAMHQSNTAPLMICDEMPPLPRTKEGQ